MASKGANESFVGRRGSRRFGGGRLGVARPHLHVPALSGTPPVQATRHRHESTASTTKPIPGGRPSPTQPSPSARTLVSTLFSSLWVVSHPPPSVPSRTDLRRLSSIGRCRHRIWSMLSPSPRLLSPTVLAVTRQGAATAPSSYQRWPPLWIWRK